MVVICRLFLFSNPMLLLKTQSNLDTRIGRNGEKWRAALGLSIVARQHFIVIILFQELKNPLEKRKVRNHVPPPLARELSESPPATNPSPSVASYCAEVVKGRFPSSTDFNQVIYLNVFSIKYFK